MLRINDVHLRWLGPLGLFVFGNLFFRLAFWLEASRQAMIHSVLVGLSAGLLFWQVGRWLVRRVQARFPGLERTPQRLLMLLLVMPLLVNAAVFFRFGLHILLGSRGSLWLGAVDYVTSFGIQLFYCIVYFTLYEGWYVLRQWQQTNLEKEALTSIHWQTQFSSLKSQVNPHFLFNSLNALSALIAESPVQAGQFVDELSKIYRYLLQANEQELILLGTEMAFIDSYVHLLQTRHGAGVDVQVNIADDYLTHLLPPLTLQLLVENAVKHNIVMASRPLLIEISTTDTGQLQVRNNIQRKTRHIAGNGVGLANIAAKYRMLVQTDISVRDDDGYFTVVLPLLT